MIKLNDYLYGGHTVLSILHAYARDLGISSVKSGNEIDRMHSEFLSHYTGLLEHNEFLTSQSQRILEFYKFMTEKYPLLSFIFKGRIKSLIRTEEKYNGYIAGEIYRTYKSTGKFPDVEELKNRLGHFRDLIAYRIVISVPACHLAPGQDKQKVEEQYLYEIANDLPQFLEERGFRPELSQWTEGYYGPALKRNLRPYYRDYICNPKESGYRSLHITVYDREAETFIEIQIRTKTMDDLAEIGAANHTDYEQSQEESRARHSLIPEGENIYFDEAFERVTALQDLDLSSIDVDMFTALSNTLMNDSCGLYRGRLILPYEHLSSYQNDLIETPELKG